MGLNWEVKDTYFFVDSANKMMLHQPFGWDIEHMFSAETDAVGRNFISYYCYNDNRFIQGITSCWSIMSRSKWSRMITRQKYYYQGYRYPTHSDNDMSRDHVIYTILAYKLSNMSTDHFKEFVDHLRWKISDKYSFTINTWLWAKIMSGRKWLLPVYYLVDIPTMLFTVIFTKIVQLIAGYGYKDELEQKYFEPIQNKDKSKRVLFYNKLMYPVYALHQNAWKAHFLPDSIFKRILQSLMFSITPKHNYVIKLLLGRSKHVTQEQVDSYKLMSTFRWSGVLHPWINDRDMRIKEDNLSKHNAIDVDYLKKLFNDRAFQI
jgi:hypothetical protein